MNKIINRVKFLWLYLYLKKHSTKCNRFSWNLAFGEIFDYDWRLFVEGDEVFVCIKDELARGSCWPAFYTRAEIKQWIMDHK